MSRSRYCVPVDIGDGVIIRAQLTKPRSQFTDTEWAELVNGLRAVVEAAARKFDAEKRP